MISPTFFLLLSGALAMAAASNSFYPNSFYPYSYYQDYSKQPSYQNYYQQPSYQNYYQQPYQNFYHYGQQQQSPFYQHQQFYPNFYQNQGFYDYPKSPLPVDNFIPYPVTDRLGWGTVAGILAPVVGSLIGSL